MHRARRSPNRPHADDPAFESLGCLRVLNDDTVAAGGGFPTHSHRDAEIWSYVLAGAIKHKDSMGHEETLPRGSVQFTSAGSGISHSEFNADASRGGAPLRFLQLWGTPNARGLKPAYQTGHFSDADKTDTLLPIIEPAASRAPGAKTLGINNGLYMHASILTGGARVALALTPARKAYIHIPILPGAAGLDVSAPGAAAARLAPGDGAFVEGVAGELSFVGVGGAADKTCV